MAGDMKQCSNCLREVPSSKLELHESHCKRHMTLCDVCDEVFPKAKTEEHEREFHALTKCDLCGEKMAKHKLDDHKDSSCIEAKVECKYCELDIRRGDYHEHSIQCGSRTDFCELCNQRVMLRDMSEHKETKCGHLKAEGPLAASEVQEIMEDDEYFNEGGDNQVEVSLDPQWLQTVAEACGEDNLDVVLAQNMFIENFRQLTENSPGINEDVPVVRDDDRGIAEQLQEDDSEERSYQVAKEMQERELAYQAQLKRDADFARQLQQDQKFHHPSQYHGHTPSSYEHGHAHSSYEHGHTPSSYEHGMMSPDYEDEQPREKPRQSSPVDDNEGKIPCQWCNKLIPFDQISQHQSSCYADMEEPYHHGGYSQQTHVPRKVDKPSSTPAEDNEDRIPCQWCKKLFPIEQITQHQRECGTTGYHTCARCGHAHPPNHSAQSMPSHAPSDIRLTDEVLDRVSREDDVSESRHGNSYINCRFCGEPCPEQLVSTHEPVCLKNPDIQLKNASYSRPTASSSSSRPPQSDSQHKKSPKTATTTESVVKAPCEFCEELFALDKLTIHQARCSVRHQIHSRSHSKPTSHHQTTPPATLGSTDGKKKLAIKFPSKPAGVHNSNKSTPSTVVPSLLVQGRRVQSSRSHPSSSWKPNGSTLPGTGNS